MTDCRGVNRSKAFKADSPLIGNYFFFAAFFFVFFAAFFVAFAALRFFAMITSPPFKTKSYTIIIVCQKNFLVDNQNFTPFFIG